MRAATAAGVLAALCPCAWALNPALDVSQYAHTSWTIRDGFFDSAIQTIAQTPDGYLWLGTEFGLFRFDGVRKVAWNPPAGNSLPSPNVLRLLVTRDGRLWIGTRAGLASWQDNRLVRYPELEEQAIWALAEDRDGTVWAGYGSPGGLLCALSSGRVQCYGQDGRFGGSVGAVIEENNHLWVGSLAGLWRWKPDPPTHYDLGPDRTANDFNLSGNGRLLIATAAGLKELAGDKIEASPIAPDRKLIRAMRLLRDRHGGLWIGTSDRGLLHVHQGRTDLFGRTDGLSGDLVGALFEDREGNVWAGTADGLDRFRDFAIPAMSSKQGLSGDWTGAVLAARDGTVWIGSNAGLTRWKGGKTSIYRQRDGLPDDAIHALLEDSHGRIWVSTLRGVACWENGGFVPIRSVTSPEPEHMAEAADGSLWILEVQRGLIHLRGTEVVERIPWLALGHRDHASCLEGDAKRGGIWLGFFDGGIGLFKDGQIRERYGSAEGLGGGRVRGVYPRVDGSIWVATEGGLSRIKDGHVATLSARNGLPCDSVRSAIEDDQHAVWLYLTCGLVRIGRDEFEAWTADPNRRIKCAVFDASDGAAKAVSSIGYSPKVTRLTDGQLWFASPRGVSIVDPRHLAENKIPPPVHIEQIIADDKPYPLQPGMRLPANVHTLRIEFTALSLVAPEKIHFKYKLDGQNKNWHEVINERQATYTNLGPRNYRFHVIACNNSGLWNETGDTLEFSIAPAWNQTSWFYASCGAAFLAMLWGLYRLRLYQIRREFNAQLDGRVDERLRVARELHDTMLQSFQAALIQMQAARNIFSRRPEKTAESLDKAINTAAGAIAEGRSAIQDLRLHPAGGSDLAELLTTAGQELARSEEAPQNPPVFGVRVEGARQDLAPLIQDEVYRISRELLRNAFRHSQAERIEVEIRYDGRQFRLHVRDDGKGIDPEILKAGGRSGHYGLPGMRERASRFGGKVEFWSEAGAGTEAVLTIPGAAAYAGSNGGRFSFLRRKLWIHER